MTPPSGTNAFVFTRSPESARVPPSYIIDIGLKTTPSYISDHSPSPATYALDYYEEYSSSKDGKSQDNIQHQQNHGWTSIFSTGVTPFGPRKWPPICTWIIAIMVLVALSGELMWSKETTGEFIELNPFNVMFGPSVQVLVQSGARYPPCMRNSAHMPPDKRYICINATTADTTQDYLFEPSSKVINQTNLSFEPTTCSLQDICGFNGFSNPDKPDQAFRFFSPLFVHSGLLHCTVNLLVLWWVGNTLERVINGWRFSVFFFLTGIFGNVFGANFAPPTATSSGSSPATFGLMASLYIELAFHWHSIQRPRRHLVKLVAFTVLGFVTLGLLPGVDSFSNLGGLLSGFLVGPSTIPSPQMRSRRSFFILWLLRCIGFGVILALLFVLINNFYNDDGSRELCTYCRYLSCLPINGFCNQ